jgi:hypothetical protein
MMQADSSPRWAPELGLSRPDRKVRLEVEFASRPYQCRCGARIPIGTCCFIFCGIPPALASFFVDRAFCNVLCARAFLVEVMDLLGSSISNQVLRDAEEAFLLLGGLVVSVDAGLRLGPTD